MKVAFFGTEQTKRLGNRLWVYIDPFSFSINGDLYTIPGGFVSDGASTPKILWSVCPPMAGPFAQGAAGHDWFYSLDGPDIGRFNADLFLCKAGRYRGASRARAQAVKSGVNYFGWMSYKKKYSYDKLTDKSCYDVIEAKAFVGRLIHG